MTWEFKKGELQCNYHLSGQIMSSILENLMVFAIPFEKTQKIQAVIWGQAFLSFFSPLSWTGSLVHVFFVTMGP